MNLNHVADLIRKFTLIKMNHFIMSKETNNSPVLCIFYLCKQRIMITVIDRKNKQDGT